MGRFARTVQESICDALKAAHPERTWQTEYRLAGTPVDVAGVGENSLVLVELEWRRADPADNAAKLFRHLTTGAERSESVLFVQVFSRYYDLKRGGVSSKRKNAEFVGEMAAESIETLRYRPISLPLDPPKRGGPRPTDWEESVETVIGTLRSEIDSSC